MEKLKLIELEMLKDLDTICGLNGLTYYLIGGALLGAVRNRGFIPWDDDIDIAMYRSDYRKIKNIVNSQYSDKYHIQDNGNDRRYPRIIAKMRLKGTALVEKSLADVDCCKEIYIDIFPLDYVKREKGVGLEVRGWMIRCIFAYKTVRSGANNGRKVLAKRFFKYVALMIPNKIIDKILEFVCEKDNSRERPFTTIFLHNYGWKKQMHRTDVFGCGERVLFENSFFMAPNKQDEFLNRVFGDYRIPPPIEKRTFPHSYVKIDFGKYDGMLNRMMKEKFGVSV